jgi:uncharacterized membrane protein (DUF485 family)
MHLILIVVAFVLALIHVIKANGKSDLGWAVLIIAGLLLWPYAR